MVNKLFVLLDFDRTLADTDQLKNDFDQLLARGLSLESALIEFGQTHQTRQAGQKYLLPGAIELLSFLQQKTISYGILTYGQADWQRAKILATGSADLPVVITDRTDKGALIASWRQASGAYQLPPELDGQFVKQIMLIDDKIYSFDGLPADALGLYCGGGQAENLPRNVQSITNLSEAQDYIGQLLDY